jgi:hypothetical protein
MKRSDRHMVFLHGLDGSYQTLKTDNSILSQTLMESYMSQDNTSKAVCDEE